MEENEWSFCSMWTERLRAGCATGLANSRLEGDYFFNRATVDACPDLAAIKKISEAFWQRGLDCFLYDRDDRLVDRGLAQMDTMYVLRAASKGNAGRTKIVRVEKQILPVWVDVFCKSFAVPEWKPEVRRIMQANFEKVELLLAYRSGLPAGCAALYRRSGMTGLYCLGTISQLRGRGVANDILKSAMSESLFLQTLASEKLLPFYRKAGFTLACTKKIYALFRPTELKGSKNHAVK